jgi:hypothetical protein
MAKTVLHIWFQIPILYKKAYSERLTGICLFENFTIFCLGVIL